MQYYGPGNTRFPEFWYWSPIWCTKSNMVLCVKKHQVTCCTWQKSIITWYYKGCKIKFGDIIYLVQTHGLHILHDHPQICDDFKVISFSWEGRANVLFPKTLFIYLFFFYHSIYYFTFLTKFFCLINSLVKGQSWGFKSRSTARVILGQVLRIATCGTRTQRWQPMIRCQTC